MADITLVSAYYEQPLMMEEWWEVLRSYGDMAPRIAIRLCDDCSQDYPLVVPDDIKTTFDIMAFRLKKDAPWQEMRCRNLCMKHVDGWAMLLDPDYMMHASEMGKLLAMPKRSHEIYQPQPRSVETQELLGRPGNMFLVHSQDFWGAGGYDEQFAGGYGFSDSVFWRCVERVVKVRKHLLDNVFMEHYPLGGNIDDAASPGLRDITRNRPIFEEVIQKMRRLGDSGYVSQREAFEYEWEQVV